MSSGAAAHVTGKFPQKSFGHLLNAHKKSARVIPRLRPEPKFVQPKDRIAVWNIEPNDRVRVTTGQFKGRFGTVDWVDRKLNRVHLKEDVFCRTAPVGSGRKGAIFDDPDFVAGQTLLKPIPIHYSNLQLVLQRSPEQEALAELERTDEAEPLPEVVATRVKAKRIRYDWRRKKWDWTRLAQSVAEVDPKTQNYTYLNWTKEDRTLRRLQPVIERAKTPGRHDTKLENVLESTFVPSLDPTMDIPPELAVRDMEFQNKYSRARRTRKYNEAKLLREEADLL